MTWVLAWGAAMLTAPLAAADQHPPAIEERLAALERRNLELEREMQELRRLQPGARSDSPAAMKPPVPIPSSAEDSELALIDSRVHAALADQWQAGLHPDGGGFFLRSPDEKIQLKLLGYVQAQGTLTDGASDASFGHGDFRVRRARIDLLANFSDEYDLFLEFDGAATGGTALRIARINAKLSDDALQFSAGKFITPFSTANNVSSRNLDTIERYIALNSMFSLPALDTQIGAMLWGTVPAGRSRNAGEAGETFQPSFTYHFGVWNGNNSGGAETMDGVGGNARDANGAKEVQLKLRYQPAPALEFGLGFDYNDAATKELRLASLSGVPYIVVDVPGLRYGASADFLWTPGRFSLRGEALHFEFDDAGTRLSGGFLQAAAFITGDHSGGVQPLVRVEHAALEGGALSGIEGNAITAFTAGVNWFLNGNLRFQVNYIGEFYDGPGNAGIGGESFRNTVLGQLQFKF